MRRYFVTGTNTDVGKTFITCKMLNYFSQRGFRTLGVKPVASDSVLRYGKNINNDVLNLIDASTIKLDYARVNSYSFLAPVSPDIASRMEGNEISMNKIIEDLDSLSGLSDYYFIEGVGGWKVPINKDCYVSDVAVQLNIPVILVVSIELGSISQSLLSLQAMYDDKAIISGWIANIKTGSYGDILIKENIASIKMHTDAPLLAIYEQERLIYDNLYKL